MKQKIIFALIYFGFVCILSSCGSTSFYVPVMKPAEVNLLAFKKIAVGEFQNDVDWRWALHRHALAQDVVDEITRALIDLRKFDVLDARNLDVISKEQNVQTSDPSEIKSEKSICLMTGRISQIKYDEEIKPFEVKQEGKPTATKYIRTGIVRMEVVIQLTEISSGKILWNRRLRSQTTASKEAINKEPDNIDQDLLRTEAQSIIVNDFMRRIMPVEEWVSVTLLTDSDMPDLEQGVKKAKVGYWTDATKIFSDATEKYKAQEKVHKAWFDLGVVYQYSYDFRHAEEAIKKALSLKDETLYKHQLDYCYQMEKEYLEVIRQQEEEAK